MNARTLIAGCFLLALAAGCGKSDSDRLAELEARPDTTAALKRDVDALKMQVATLQGTAGVDLKPLEDRLAALEAKMAALPPPVDVKPLEDRIAALEALKGVAVKLPHLVVDKTGEDLGQLIVSPAGVWSPKLNAELLSVIGPTLLLFDMDNCKGTTAMQNVRKGAYANGTDGHIWKANKAAEIFQSRSYLSEGNCKNELWSSALATVTDTGMPVILYPAEQLRLELR